MNATAADRIEGRIIHEEHQRLRTGLAALEQTITDAYRLSRPELSDRVHRALEWIRRDLLPHAAWEDAWLYPQLDREAETPWATRILRFEHQQIGEIAAGLEGDAQELRGRWSLELAFRVVARVASLHCIVAAHVAQEERFVLPVLDTQPLVASHRSERR